MAIAVCLLFVVSTTQSAIIFTENPPVKNKNHTQIIDETSLTTTNENSDGFVNSNCIVIAYGKLTYIEGNDFIIPFVYKDLRWAMNPGSCWTLGISGFQKCRDAWYLAGTADEFFFGFIIGNLNGNTLFFGITKWIGIQILG